MQTQLIRTQDTFTTGIVNLPILFTKDNKPDVYIEYKKKTNKEHKKYRVVPDMRYPYFELDTEDINAFNKVVKAYYELKLPVYIHRTMRGFHFICLVAIHKDCYAEWIKPLMKLNPKCPMVTLRIKPNKWLNESRVFKDGVIVDNGASSFAIEQLTDFKRMMELHMYGLIGMKYYVVHYRMTGELGNDESLGFESK